LISDFLEWFYEKLELNFNKKYSHFIPNKWEIYFVNLWTNIWSELNKNRPCIVYSNYFFNSWDNIVILPLKGYKWKTNKSLNIFLSSSKVEWLYKDSIVDLMWIRQISKKRMWKLIWKLKQEKLISIDKKLLKVLNIKK
jgi:mRNA-degrading endonuclease toxin of MazEF toxin-antitoxin module